MNCTTDRTARASRNPDACLDTPTQTSDRFDADTTRAMLSELSGTPLREGAGWDREAMDRMKAFQHSEGLPATGEPDDVTIGRLTVRYEMAIEGHAETSHAPTHGAQERVAKAFHRTMHAASDVSRGLVQDAGVRQAYIREVEACSKKVLDLHAQGKITEAEASFMANELRNNALRSARTELSPAGHTLSKFLKEEGLTLAAAREKYAAKQFGRAYGALAEGERAAIDLHVARRAGVTNASVNRFAGTMTHVSRAAVALTVAVAVYDVATAEDKVRAVSRQAAALAGAEIGTWAGGVAGMAVCGPPCALAGSLAGGILGAIVAEQAIDYAYVHTRA